MTQISVNSSVITASLVTSSKYYKQELQGYEATLLQGYDGVTRGPNSHPMWSQLLPNLCSIALAPQSLTSLHLTNTPIQHALNLLTLTTHTTLTRETCEQPAWPRLDPSDPNNPNPWAPVWPALNPYDLINLCLYPQKPAPVTAGVGFCRYGSGSLLHDLGVTCSNP